LLGGGVAGWIERGRLVPSTTKPVTARPTAPVPAAAPSPPPLAAPVAPPAAPVAQDTSVTTSPAALPVPAPPAMLDRAATDGSGKRVASRARPTRARHSRRAIHARRARRATRAVPARPTESEPPVSSKAASASAPGETANAGALLLEAQRVRKRGRFAAAIKKAREALEDSPTPAQARQAYELIGVCSCSLGDASAAREATAHLVGRSRGLVKAMCEEMGHTID